jgi:small subunit ribosomal protein S4e
MVKRHLSRLNAPKSWPIRRKGIQFIIRPNPGNHTLRTSIPLLLVLTRILKYARTNKEVKKILNEGKVIVNDKLRKNKAYPVGVMDVVRIPTLNENFIVLFDNKGKFILNKIDDKQAELRMVKVENKTLIKGAKIQINNTNGTTFLVKEDKYKTGDTLVLTKNKITEQISFEKDATVYLTGGKRIGTVGKIQEIKEGKILVKPEDGEKFETARRYGFVIGKHNIVGKK